MGRLTKAQKLAEYQTLLTRMIRRARVYGATTGEINAALTDFGMPLTSTTTAPGRAARYQTTVWVTVNTPDMDQVQAQGELDRYINNNNAEGYIDESDGQNGHEVVPGSVQWTDNIRDANPTWLSADEYWAQHQPPASDDTVQVTDLNELKAKVRKHFLRIAAAHSWGCSVFRSSWNELDLGDIPQARSEVRRVPVTGDVEISMYVWEGMTDADLDAIAAARIQNDRDVYVRGARVVEPGPVPATS